MRNKRNSAQGTRQEKKERSNAGSNSYSREVLAAPSVLCQAGKVSELDMDPLQRDIKALMCTVRILINNGEDRSKCPNSKQHR